MDRIKDQNWSSGCYQSLLASCTEYVRGQVKLALTVMAHLVAQASKCKQPKWCHLFGYSQGSVEPSSHSENSSSVTTSTAVNTWAWRSPGCCCCTAGWSTEIYLHPTIFSICPPQAIVWPLLHFLRLHSYCHCIFSIQSWEDSRFWSMKCCLRAVLTWALVVNVLKLHVPDTLSV